MTGQPPLPQPPSAGKARVHLGIAAGISDFAKLRRDHKYYVDKTRQLAALLDDDSGPLLLTRPRRFGKTLTLDTLRRFLELDYQDPGNTAVQRQLFAGLAILEDPQYQACRERYMGRHPVVAVSFNTVEGRTWSGALQRLCTVVAAELGRHAAHLHEQLPESTAGRERMAFYTAVLVGTDRQLQLEILPDVLPALVSWLHQVYSRPVYILIDEYDTPLAKAWSNEHARSSEAQDPQGYYSGMADLLRGLLHPLLKPQPAAQDSIARCICTGCTRISRESLFSGANNLTVLGMDRRSTAELMGFTQEEVQEMLDYYELGDHLREVEEWYDGYRFAGVRIYNPWSIANYCQAQLDTPGCAPVSYWAHAGRNDELTCCLHELSGEGLELLQQLYAGQRVSLPVQQDFSYDELLHHPDQGTLFTLLYHTGYITPDGEAAAPRWRIPNAEVRQCFERQILGLYDFLSEAEAGCSAALVRALAAGRGEDVRRALNELFGRYLSFHGYVMRSALARDIVRLLDEQAPELAEEFAALDDRRPERVYQLYVAGVLSGHAGHALGELVLERELSEGRADLSFIAGADGQCGCVLEFKKAAAVPRGSEHYGLRLQEQCSRAAEQGLEQIDNQGYARGLLQLYPALRQVQAYGIGCAGKRCAVAWRRYGREELQG